MKRLVARATGSAAPSRLRPRQPARFESWPGAETALPDIADARPAPEPSAPRPSVPETMAHRTRGKSTAQTAGADPYPIEHPVQRGWPGRDAPAPGPRTTSSPTAPETAGTSRGRRHIDAPPRAAAAPIAALTPGPRRRPDPRTAEPGPEPAPTPADGTPTPPPVSGLVTRTMPAPLMPVSPSAVGTQSVPAPDQSPPGAQSAGNPSSSATPSPQPLDHDIHIHIGRIELRGETAPAAAADAPRRARERRTRALGDYLRGRDR